MLKDDVLDQQHQVGNAHRQQLRFMVWLVDGFGRCSVRVLKQFHSRAFAYGNRLCYAPQ